MPANCSPTPAVYKVRRIGVQGQLELLTISFGHSSQAHASVNTSPLLSLPVIIYMTSTQLG